MVAISKYEYPDRVNIGYIYLIVCIANGKHYVGQTRKYRYENRIKLGVTGRYNQHIYNAETFRDDCPKLNRAIRKYGKDNFMVTELIQCEIDELNYYEEYYVSIFNSAEEGYNCTLGGDYPKVNEKQRKKMNASISEKAKKRWSDDDYHKNVSEKVRATAAINGQKNKQGDNLPPNIVIIKGRYDNHIGYAAKIVINGVLYRKAYTSTQETYTEKLTKAKEYLAEIKETHGIN